MRKFVQNFLTHSMHYYFHQELTKIKLVRTLPFVFLQLQESIWRTMLWIIFVALIVHFTMIKLVQNSLTHSMHYYFHRELLKKENKDVEEENYEDEERET